MPRKRLQTNARNRVTLQLHDIFKLLQIEHTIEAERLAQTLLNFIVYMAPHDELKTPWCSFVKMAPDLVCIKEISQELMASHAADSMDARAIINLPI